LIRWFPQSARFHFLRGSVLHYAGRLTESEQSFRISIANARNRARGAKRVALTSLGHVLLLLGRFRDATAAFDASKKLDPQYAGALNGLAEALLRQEREPQRALLLLENAINLKQGNVRTRNMDRHNLANMWANRALALAMLGRIDEAASAVTTARYEGDAAFIPGLASTAWRCGLALLRMNQAAAAYEQFRKAAEMDPNGLYGKFSASAMQEQHAARVQR
jgi:tetratricopeptide (TPR) repeat protein